MEDEEGTERRTGLTELGAVAYATPSITKGIEQPLIPQQNTPTDSSPTHH